MAVTDEMALEETRTEDSMADAEASPCAHVELP